MTYHVNSEVTRALSWRVRLINIYRLLTIIRCSRTNAGRINYVRNVQKTAGKMFNSEC